MNNESNIEKVVDANPEYEDKCEVVDLVQIPTDELEYLKITLDTLTEMFKDLSYRLDSLEGTLKEEKLLKTIGAPR